MRIKVDPVWEDTCAFSQAFLTHHWYAAKEVSMFKVEWIANIMEPLALVRPWEEDMDYLEVVLLNIYGCGKLPEAPLDEVFMDRKEAKGVAESVLLDLLGNQRRWRKFFT
jgi:hypothetical protein